MKNLLLPVSVSIAFTAALSAEDWPHFQGPHGTGISTETGLNLKWGDKEPAILWEKELNEGFGGAAIVGDEVFLVDRDIGERDKLLSLSLKDGSENWSFSFDFPGKLSFHGSRGVPLVEDDAVYFISGFGQVFRINRETHKQDWMVPFREKYGVEEGTPKWGWAQSPVIVGDILIVPAHGENAGLVGLDKKTGEVKWETEGFGNSHSNPAVLNLQGVEQVVYVAVNNVDGEKIGTTISVRPTDGEVLWKTDLYMNSIPIPFPTKVTEELVFLTGGYDCGSAMVKVTKKDDGLWGVEKVFDMVQGTQVHPPFVIDEHIYFLANENSNHKGEKRENGGLMCMDFGGEILWHTGDDPFMGRGNMILADGHLLIQDGEVGFLRVVEPSPEGYKEVAFADPFGKKEEAEERKGKLKDYKMWSPMALSNGRLIVRGQNQLKCLDLRK
ncbi:MAG: PQQ-like beta-propeller repeat protein [Verrucomicrobiales bacterium]|nr:PQQ-like beta-propeller repeat protein [Verrucomicrobiales bacterium]